jgi:hypothetical protein
VLAGLGFTRCMLATRSHPQVQRQIETKALQPMVLLRMRQTVFQAAPGQLMSIGSGATGARPGRGAPSTAVRVQMDTDVRALLEYSTDGQVSKPRWPFWRAGCWVHDELQPWVVARGCTDPTAQC